MSDFSDIAYRLSELERRIENITTIGVILDTDYNNKKLKIKIGDTITDWLAWPAKIGRNFISWRPLRLGQQVVLCAPSGDLANAVIVAELYSDQQPSPSGHPDIDCVVFEDGTIISHDVATKSLEINAATLGSLKLRCGRSCISITDNGVIIASPDFLGVNTS